MKEFEKRWNFRYKDLSINQSKEREIARYFWKAALEWIIKEQGSSYWVNEVSDLINKELNDE